MNDDQPEQPAGEADQPLVALERLLLRDIPGDSSKGVPAGAGMRAVLAQANALLTRNPELGARITREVDQAWSASGGQRAEFEKATRPTLLELVGRVRTAAMRPEVERASARHRSELERYLAMAGDFPTAP